MGLYGLDVGELVFEDPNTARSVLDGARLETRIASVRIASVPRTIEPVDSDAKVCTLLTTATALDSRTALKLPADRTIDTADGRRVYKFVRRNRVTDDAPVDDFAPEVSGALVTAVSEPETEPLGRLCEIESSTTRLHLSRPSIH